MRKLVWKEMKRSWFFNLLLLIQLIAVFLVMISMVSTIVSRFRYYQPLMQLLDTKGNYYHLNFMNDPLDNRYLVYEDKQLKTALPEAENIYSTAQVTIRCRKIPEMYQCHAYNQNMVNLYHPQMQAGIWLNKVKETESDTIPGVIGCNTAGIQIGDVLEIENGLLGEDEQQPYISVKVIGIIAENEKVLLSSETYENDYRDVYLSCENDAGNTPVLFLRQQDFEEYADFMNCRLSGDLFVSYPDSITEDALTESQEIIKDNAEYTTSMEFSEVKEGSLDYIAEQVYTLLPIAAGVLILTLTGAMSVNAISMKKQLRNFSIYYICGLQWKKCIRINTILLFLQVLFAGIVSFAMIEIGQWTGLLNNTVIQFGIWQLLCCIAIGCFYLGLSLLLPLQILHKTTPNEVLKTN